MNLKKYPVITRVNAVNEIVSPFLDRCNLNFMNYSILLNEGGSCGLATNPEVCEDFIENKFTLSASEVCEGNHMWDSFKSSDAVKFIKEKYNYTNIFVCSRKISEGTEMFSFAAPAKNKSVTSLYLNHFEYFEKFMVFFKYSAKNLIQEAIKNPVVLPQEMYCQKPISMSSPDSLDDVLKVNKFEVEGNKGLTYLTPKEFNVLKMYVRGLSTKEIAARLYQSPKTVEFHVGSAKRKLGISKKRDLINRFEATII